jgi:RHS repeat-associated protein
MSGGAADAGGLLSAVQYPATPALNVGISYDAYDRPSAASDGTGTHSWLYDDLDAVTSATTTYTGLPARTISYGFYADGSRQSMSTPAGSFSYLYDGAQRMVSLTNPFAEVSGWSYLDNDWLWTQTLGNGAYSTNTFNALGQLTALENRTAGGALLSSFTGMTHDGAGNRLQVTASIPGHPAYSGTTSWQYDSNGQLTQEQSGRNGGWLHTFGYDLAGNPTTFKGVARTFNSNNQETTVVHDGAGNPATHNGNALTWDPENGMTAYGAVITAGYRADGLRAWKQNSAGRTYFLYDGISPVVELDAVGNVTATNTFGAGGLLSRRSGGASVFYTFDERGSVVQRMDGFGGALSSHLYDAYGVGSSSVATGDPFGFGGQWGYYRDAETGLELCTLRYYGAGGRWLSRDLIGYEGGINLYGYVGNAPTAYTDPLGLLPAEGNQQARSERPTGVGGRAKRP